MPPCTHLDTSAQRAELDSRAWKRLRATDKSKRTLII